jgi:hypothetical protein
MSEKKQASIQNFLKPVVRSSIDLPIRVEVPPQIKLIKKILVRDAKAHIWCGTASGVEGNTHNYYLYLYRPLKLINMFRNYGICIQWARSI